MQLSPKAGALCLLAAPALAQMSETLGPLNPPLGCPVHYTFNNDGPVPVWWDPCGVRIYDSAGALVFDSALGCGPPVQLQAGDVHHTVWHQTYLSGLQVPPGAYFFDSPGGPQIHVGGSQASIAQLGAAKLGTARSFELCSPQDPAFPYLLMASGSFTTGIPTCAGTIPLDVDLLLEASLLQPAVFQGFFGVLDHQGRSQSPTLALPLHPGLAGVSLRLAFVVLDFNLPACGVRRISELLQLTLF